MFWHKVIGEGGNLPTYNSNYLNNAKAALQQHGVELSDASNIQLFANRGKVKYALADIDGDGVFDKKVKVNNNRYRIKDLKPKRAQKLAAKLQSRKDAALVTLNPAAPAVATASAAAAQTAAKPAQDENATSQAANVTAANTNNQTNNAAIEELKKVVEDLKAELEATKELLAEQEKTTQASEQTAKANATKIEAKELCEKFHDAIDPNFGTNNKEFKEVLNALNPDNIVEVMNEWDRKYGKDYGESFIKSFAWDANHRQKRDYGKKIVEHLQARAAKAGVNVEEFAAHANKTLGSWWINNGTLSKNVEAMLNIINEKEFPELAKKEEKEDDKKAA